MNLIHIAGHLGADPEEGRFTSGGQKVRTLRVATRSRRSGQDKTIWWKVTIWGEQFDRMLPHFKKGSPIYIVGDYQESEIYTDRNGKPQVSNNMVAISIHFSPFGRSDKNDQQQEKTENDYSSAASGVQAGANNELSSDDLSNEEIPF